jgi:carboxyl-terminal processing protease
LNARLLAVLLAVAGLVVGLYLGGHPDKLPDSVRDVFVDDKIDLTAEVIDLVDEKYWKEVDNGELEEGSARGIVENLRKRYDDRFSHYFNAQQFSDFNDATEGAYAGVGLGVAEVPEGLRVSTVFPKSPAKEAGLKEGDLITAVDGESLAGVESTVATGKIKGEPGTPVTITVVSGEGKGEPREVPLTRARISLPVVRGRLLKAGGTQVAYVQMAQFSPDVSSILRRQIEKFRGKGAEGLILDLRGNPGGLLQEAVLTSSIFLEDGVVVSTESRTQGDVVYHAQGDALDEQPTVVLTSKDTASAAEILAAALAQNDLATTVGQTTYGKGVFQQVVPLDAGGGLDLTVGEYLTSDGTSIAKKGVVPEVKVPDDPDATGDPVLERGRAVLAGLLGR